MNYALPQTMLKLDIVNLFNEGGESLGFYIAKPEASAVYESARQYTFQYRPRGGSSDNIKVSTDVNGFLSGVTINRTDEISTIVEATSSFLRTAITGLPSAERGSERGAEPVEPTVVLAEVAYFNPDDAGALDDVNIRLSAYQLALRPVGDCSRTPVAAGSEALYYARRTPRVLQVQRIVADGSRPTIAIVQYESTNCDVGAFDVGDFDWVNSEISLTFDKGVLTEAEIKKPSETAAVASLPLVVADNVLGVARDLLTVRIQRIDSESDLMNAEKDFYAAQTARLEALQGLEDATEDAEDEEEEEEEDPRPAQGGGSGAVGDF